MSGSIDEVYVGETSSLRRRIATNYRSPGVSQSTSIRINAWLIAQLADNWEVGLDFAVTGEVTTGVRTEPAAFAASWTRRLAENAILGIKYGRKDRRVINLNTAPS